MVVFSVHDTARALRTAPTWSSRHRSELDSTLDLVFMFDKFARGTLPNFLDHQAMLPILDGASSRSYVLFKGKMSLDLVGTMDMCISVTDKLYARSVASYVEVDTTVLLNGVVNA